MQAERNLQANTNAFLAHFREYTVILGFLLIFGLQSVLIPNFFTVQNIINVARQISANAILAVGMTYVIISGGIDLSVGSGVAFLGVFSAIMVTRHMGFVPTIVITLVAGTAIGLLNGLVVAYAKIPPFIVTLASLSVVRGAALAVSGGQSVSDLGPLYAWIGRGYFGPIPVPIIIMLVVYLVGYYVLSNTRFGVYTYSIGGSENISRIMGIRIESIKIRLYAISGFLMAIAAIILASRLNSGQPLIGQGFELDAVASVVLGGSSLFGGTGTLIGTFFGASIIGILSNGLTLLGMSYYYQLGIKGVIIILAIWIGKERKKER
jgi:ribose transport system permease protein